MNDLCLKDKCRNNTNYGSDTFVGIDCTQGDISISFPLGYHISEDNEGVRKDILLLLNSIASTVGRKESKLYSENKSLDYVGFPIHAYMYIIADFFERGYYKERDVLYSVSTKGKIHWGKTIKTQVPYVQGTDIYYLDFVTRKSQINENEIITSIHEYCVYDSFCKMGWLFTKYIPKTPTIKFNRKLFKNVIVSKLLNTYNDKNRKLFRNLIAVIDSIQDKDSSVNFKYGTSRFEYVWEAMIDNVFGIVEKKEYFPQTVWKIRNNSHDNPCLEPDTIMVWNNDVYVLDAKYYKYGSTLNPKDMPESTSINKQITYGEYIDQAQKFKEKHGKDFTIYNAFILPFDSDEWHIENNIFHVGEAISNWKGNRKIYERIQGVLLDVKSLMSIRVNQDASEIEKLAKCIQDGIRLTNGIEPTSS